MGWSLQNITKWSRHAQEPAHTDSKRGKKILYVKIFFSITKTGRVKKIMVFIVSRGTFLSFAKLNFL
jgi:hypothetical protein